jgi:release factor glutamine methyltransferase
VHPGAQVHELAVADALDLTVADVVVANPPYLPTGSADDLAPEVRDFDPPRSLWGGGDGLHVLRQVGLVSASLLRPGGRLAVEHDARHQPEVMDLLRQSGFDEVAGHVDLTGRPRFVTGSRR